MGAAAEGRRAHFGVAAEGRHLYLSKTQAKLVFLWSRILPGPFFDPFLDTFGPLFGHVIWEGPNPFPDHFLTISIFGHSRWTSWT